MSFLHDVVQVLFVCSGIVMIIFIMLRKGDSGGLSGAFGGIGGDTAFGVKTQKHLDRIISYIAGVFIITAILLNVRQFKKARVQAPQGNLPTEKVSSELPPAVPPAKLPVKSPNKTPAPPSKPQDTGGN